MAPGPVRRDRAAWTYPLRHVGTWRFSAEQIGVPIKLVGVGPGREQFVRFAA